MTKKLVVPAVVVAFLICLSLFFDGKLSPGMNSEATDWAMYVIHARNIATGHPYTETCYVFQPESATEVGANAYPSGYPLMLAPFYAAEGFDLRLFKLLNIAFLVLSLWPAYLYARRTLSQLASLILIAAFGFSWLFFTNFDGVGSDAPYELISLWVLLLILRIYDRGFDESKSWLWGVLAGLAIAAAYLIRPFGIAFLLAIAGVEIWRKRKISAFLIASTIAFAPLLLLNNVLFHTDGGYTHQFTLSLIVIVHHALEYAGFFSYVFANPVSKLFRYGLWALSLIAVVFGIVRRLRQGIGVTELYIFVLLAVDSVYWATTARYLLPIMPIYMVYMFEGFQAIAEKFPKGLVMPLKAAAAALLLFAPAANAFLMHSEPEDTLIASAPYESLCIAVRRQTPPQALFLFWNPRVFALSTSRHASGWPEGKPEDMIHYLQRVHPAYVIEDKTHSDDQKFLIPVLSDPAIHSTTVYENNRFRLLQLAKDSK